MKKNLFVLLLSLLSVLDANAQNIDSLKKKLATAKEDTTKYNILSDLYWYYVNSYPCIKKKDHVWGIAKYIHNI